MEKLNNFITEIQMVGSIYDADGQALTLQDYDSILSLFNRIGIKGGEIMIYASPKFLKDTQDLLDEIFAVHSENVNTGKWKNDSINSWSFLVEMSFSRGSYTFNVVSRDIEGAVFIPTSADEENWGAYKTARKSILVK